MSSPFKRLKEVYARTYSLDTGRDADFFDCVNDIYFSPEVQSLKKYPQHDKMDRLQHITSVAYLTFRVCRHFGLDYRKAARAATMQIMPMIVRLPRAREPMDLLFFLIYMSFL